jgi:hypothetical protein
MEIKFAKRERKMGKREKRAKGNRGRKRIAREKERISFTRSYTGCYKGIYFLNPRLKF